MNGLKLAKDYYEQFGKPMLEKDFPELLPEIAVGLCGPGSECLGYDDAVSEDHDFEPGFCIFLEGGEDEENRKKLFRLERAYAKLPKEFGGHKRSMMSAVGGNRHGIIEIRDFLLKTTGTTDGVLSPEEWLKTPEMSLLEATNGEIWSDGKGELTRIREGLSYLPEDVRLKKLAGSLLLMAQAGQYNYTRSVQHGERAAAQLACFEFVRSGIHVCHLLERRYMPYYKWAFRSLRNLGLSGGILEAGEEQGTNAENRNGFYRELADDFEGLIESPNDDETAESKYFVIEDIAARLIDRLMEQGITEATCGDLEKHAYSVNDRIGDPELRNLHILAAVDSAF